MTTQEKQQTAALNVAQFSSFVSPENCELLRMEGVQMIKPLFTWVVMNDQAHIRSYVYDYDGYYRNADKLIDTLHKPLQLTAYTSGMLERALPPYTVCKTACGEYELLCDKYYNVNEVRAPRLPDAMAKMLVQLMKLRRLSPEFVNNILNNIL